jgi:methanethiol S-methyltransferase
MLAYGLVCYTLFLVTFLYAIAFIGNLWEPLGLHGESFRSLDSGGTSGSSGSALAIDALLLGAFALQHSGMARGGFKRWWTRIVPEPIERSTYVLFSSLCLILLFWQWRPVGTTVLWDLSAGPLGAALLALSLVGYGVVLLSTFQISHWSLFGLRQVWDAFRGRATVDSPFTTPPFYRAVRHPLYLGFMIGFWATPVMTLSHLVFALATTGYILVAIQLEERDLVAHFGGDYVAYRRAVPMLVPFARRAGGRVGVESPDAR